MSGIYKVYAFLFGRTFFLKFNKFLYNLGLRGLGILNYQNEYLIGEKKWLKKFLKNKKNPIIIDVGANVGNYSKMIMNFSQSAKILAFEPHPATYQRLVENINSTNFQAFNFGVSNSKGRLRLYDYKTNDGSSHASFYIDVIKDLHKKKSIYHEVNVISLDDFLCERKISKIDLIKIDTEGNELNVLLGLKKFISKKKIKAIHFEFNEMNAVSKSTFKDFWELLSDFDFYRLLPGGGLLSIKDYSPINTEIYAFQNIIAILK